MSQKAWTLPGILKELKKYLWKACGCSQPQGHLIQVLNERSDSGSQDYHNLPHRLL